jgi:S1-C subfamily serine protease
LASHSNRDKIKLKYGRSGKVREIEVRLKARSTDSKLADANDGNFNSRILGAELRTLTEEELRSNSVTNGVKVLKMTPQSILAEAGVRDGFLITSLDKKPITSPEQLERIIAATKGGALIEGQYPNGKKAYYALAPTND